MKLERAYLVLPFLSMIMLRSIFSLPSYRNLGRTIKHSAVAPRYYAPSKISMSHFRLYSSNENDLDPVIRAKDVQVPLDKYAFLTFAFCFLFLFSSAYLILYLCCNTRIEFSFARSSGPGGQNVNKLNTKAELRFHVQSASWLQPEVRLRLAQYQTNKVSKEGDLIISSQEHRTQSKNKDDCVEKLKIMIAEAMLTPKEREMWVGISERGKEQRKNDKRKRGDVKEGRKRIKDFD